MSVCLSVLSVCLSVCLPALLSGLASCAIYCCDSVVGKAVMHDISFRRYQEKMDALNEYLEENKVPQHVRNQVRAYYIHSR